MSTHQHLSHSLLFFAPAVTLHRLCHTGGSCCSQTRSSFIISAQRTPPMGYIYSNPSSSLPPYTFSPLHPFLDHQRYHTSLPAHPEHLLAPTAAVAGEAAIMNKSFYLSDKTTQNELVIGQLHYPPVPREQEVHCSWIWIGEGQSRTERFSEGWVTCSTKPGMNKWWQIQQQGVRSCRTLLHRHWKGPCQQKFLWLVGVIFKWKYLGWCVTETCSVTKYL